MKADDPAPPLAFRSVLGAALIAISGALTLIVVALVQERENRVEAAIGEAENTSRMMAGYVLQSIQKVDMVMQDVQGHIQPADMRARSGRNIRRAEELHRLLVLKLSSIPEGSVLHVTNAGGNHAYSSVAPVPRINIADRSHFRRQREKADAGLVISEPLISRTTGKWAFVLSRRLDFEDRGFAGTVNMVVNLEGLEKFFATLDVRGRGVVSLRDRQMTLMARFPIAEGTTGKPVIDPARDFLRQGQDHGVYRAVSPVDGVMRLYSFRAVGNLGLYAFAGVAEEDYLSDWRAHVKAYGLAGLVLAVTVLVMLFAARRGLIERERTLAVLAREEEKFHTVADYTFDWEYWEGPGHEILYMSPSCMRVTGYSQPEFLAEPNLLSRIVHPDDRERMDQHRRDAKHDEEDGGDFRIVRRDGEIRWIAHGCRSVFGRDGKFIGRRVSNRDITERKRAEEEVHRLNAELEQRVVQRTMQLESANKELEEFSYSISHDMRAPLRAIHGFSQILLEEHGARLDEEGKRLLGVVRDNAQRLGRQIDDILRFLRMGRRKMEGALIDMAQLAREAFAELQAATPARRPRLDIGDLPPAWGDREMLRLALLNLLSNAIKFSAANGEAAIELSGAVEEAENVYAVKDHGVGFDMRYVDKLFKVFERVHPTGQYEGTGIGLALVKRIVERHGGRVWAEGRVGAGATFHFSLPNRRK